MHPELLYQLTRARIDELHREAARARLAARAGGGRRRARRRRLPSPVTGSLTEQPGLVGLAREGGRP